MSVLACFTKPQTKDSVTYDINKLRNEYMTEEYFFCKGGNLRQLLGFVKFDKQSSDCCSKRRLTNFSLFD